MQQMQQVLAKSISYTIHAKGMENKENFVNSIMSFMIELYWSKEDERSPFTLP
jgi:hypothetical protein